MLTDHGFVEIVMSAVCLYKNEMVYINYVQLLRQPTKLYSVFKDLFRKDP